MNTHGEREAIVLSIRAACGLAAIGSLLVFCRTSTAQPDLVTNGGFEVPAIGVPNAIITVGNTGMTGWNIGGASGIDIVRSLWQPAAGYQSVSLNWTSPCTIVQTLSTTPGACYTLSFRIAAENPATDGTIRSVRVRWGGATVLDTTFNPTGHTNASMGWRLESVSVMGHGSDELRFESTTPGAYGPALDDVRVTPQVSVTAQPSPVTACPGADAAFSVGASGAGPFSYRWQGEKPPQSGVFADLIDGPTGSGSVITGAGSADLQIIGVTSADATRYRCVVANVCGFTATNAEALTVLPSCCDTVDFNNDGLFPDTADIDDMLSVFSGGACTNDPNCHDIDFNNDGLFPDTLDIDSLLSVFSGGACL